MCVQAGPAARSETAHARSQSPSDDSPLLTRLPEIDPSLSKAVLSIETSIDGDCARLWAWLGLQAPVAHWSPSEERCLQLLVARMNSSPGRDEFTSLRQVLLRLAARRYAELLAEDLARVNEATWELVFANRYEQLRKQCGRRHLGGHRMLAQAFARDWLIAGVATRRLDRWIRAGTDLSALPGELEAVLVEAAVTHIELVA